MNAIERLREALVRPYREIKDPSFFVLDELPEFEALAAVDALYQAAKRICDTYQLPALAAAVRRVEGN